MKEKEPVATYVALHFVEFAFGAANLEAIDRLQSATEGEHK
jgi:hypothetical protein